mgnify:CR=1 FL=1
MTDLRLRYMSPAEIAQMIRNILQDSTEFGYTEKQLNDCLSDLADEIDDDVCEYMEKQ